MQSTLLNHKRDRTTQNTIVYTDFESPLGDMIGGATEHGLCFLEWHDRGGVDRILARIEKRYKAIPSRAKADNKLTGQLRSELAEYFKGNRKKFNVAIDVTGTAFQMKVWEELMHIKCGATRSYGDMAECLGKPGAMRAVGTANGSNYLAVVIPCHRVIRHDGTLGGYGGKIWRKKWLLELESGVKPLKLKL